MSVGELCPECVRDFQFPGCGGFCKACHMRRLQQDYAREDRDLIEANRQRWVDRQRRHREHARLRPSELLADDADVLQVGKAAVFVLEKMSKRLARTPGDAAAFDDLIETVKQLAWGLD